MTLCCAALEQAAQSFFSRHSFVTFDSKLTPILTIAYEEKGMSRLRHGDRPEG
ncbi:hypothetical protein SAMN06265218_11239 [Fodinibius sediminis]|uniref:Uncharacterized protein n=1 Tax=Fodinibius sediminis TaxID=1214077 RepID=A0A521DXD7_9BACT|nr:hypothetical protein SAMN06265218_11239 [Fodinibius sediminis]